MKYYKDIKGLKIEHPTAITVGKFDGLHVGHERLTEKIIEQNKLGLESTIITFSNSPREALSTGEDVKYLITNEERYHILEKAGIDNLIECPFDDSFMRILPREFISLLIQRLSMKYMVAGSDFRFGYKGEGDVKMLMQLAKEYDFSLEIIEKIKDDGKDISSTYIRDEIKKGNVGHATEMLGYPYFIVGTIVHGQHLGHKLGVPTINIIPPQIKLLPQNGVYYTQVYINGKKYYGMTNVGVKPTVDGDRAVGVETHILNFSENIYNEVVKVVFLEKKRGEVKFSSIKELKQQLLCDRQDTIAYFSKENK